MSALDLTDLPAFLASRRWYAGRGRNVKRVGVLDEARLGDDGRFHLLLVEVSYELGTPERYLLPLVSGPGGEPAEGLDDPALPRALLDFARAQRSAPSVCGMLSGERLPGTRALDEVAADAAVRLVTAEQSNSSVVLGERVILKVLRKFDRGVNPEWEVGRFLTAHGFNRTPPLLGAISVDGVVRATLVVAHEFVQVEADGWSWLLSALRGTTAPPPAVLEEVRQLGVVLAELHAALASDPHDAAFAPEPLRREDLQRWASSIIGELGVTVASVGARVPELPAHHDALVDRIGRLAHLPPSGQRARVHGDLHLGQTLRRAGTWNIFDFEGEPSRSYVQRREKVSPLRDAASMLRSLEYAHATLESEGHRGDRLPALRDAFLAGYRSALRVPALLPDAEVQGAMLDAFEVEKLLYELRYEAQHRPDWLHIPARALLALLER